MSNDTVGRLNVALDMRLNSLEASIAQANKKVATMSRRMHSDVAKAARSMNAALSSLGVGLSIAGVAAFTKSVIDLGGKITDLSRQAGISTDAFQTLSIVAMDSGVSGEQVAQSFVKMRQSIEEGSKAFDVLGLSSRALKDIGAEQAFEVIARSIVNAKDQSAAFNAALDILGAKTAPKLQEVLQRLGTEGMPALSKEFKNLKLTNEQIEQLDRLGDTIGRIGLGFKVAAAQILDFSSATRELAAVKKLNDEIAAKYATDDERRKMGMLGGGVTTDPFGKPIPGVAQPEDTFTLKNIDRRSETISEMAYEYAKRAQFEATVAKEIADAQAKTNSALSALRDEEIYSGMKSQDELEKLFSSDQTFDDSPNQQLADLFSSNTETFSQDWEVAYEETSEASEQFARDMEQTWDFAMDGFSSAIADAVVDGEVSFENLANSFSKMVVQMAVKWAMLKTMESVGLATGSGWAGVFSGARADGGPVSGGSTYLVGEEGPELFTPRSSGMIVPNNKLSATTSGNDSMVFHIDARGASADAVARLEMWKNDMERNFQNRVKATVSDARLRGERI